MRWTRQRQAMSGDGRAGHKARELTNGTQTNDACCGLRSRVVLAPVAGVKSRRLVAQPGINETLIRDDGDNQEFAHRGEHGISVKTIARGMPGESV